MGAPPYAGQQRITDAGSRFNATSFIARQALGKIWTAIPVQVIAVHGGGVAPVGTVDVLPLVNQIDAEGNSTPHGTVFALPYFRLQGGSNAVIIDPQVSDIGLAVFAHRDVSAVKATKGQANPGSFRRFDPADGFYIGGFLNGTPTQYVEFTSTGISIIDKNDNQIVMGASGISLNGVVIDRSGNVSAPGDVTGGVGGSDSVTLQNHIHGGVETGSGSTAKPTAGT